MKRIGIITLFAALFCFMITNGAMALPVWQTPNVEYKFKFEDYEKWIDVNNNKIFDVGDKITGIINITDIYKKVGSGYTRVWSTNSTQYGSDELTGTFVYEVKNKKFEESDNISSEYFGKYLYTLKDEVYLYYDTTPDFNSTYTVNHGAADGVLWAILKTDNMTMEGYGDNVTAWRDLDNLSHDIATVANAPLSVFYNNTGVGWIQPLHMASTIRFGGDGNTNWTFDSDDPLIATTVPEPATIMLLGAGLLGLGSWGRKKTKKSKES